MGEVRASYQGSREPAGRAGRREGRRRSYSPWRSRPCRGRDGHTGTGWAGETDTGQPAGRCPGPPPLPCPHPSPVPSPRNPFCLLPPPQAPLCHQPLPAPSPQHPVPSLPASPPASSSSLGASITNHAAPSLPPRSPPLAHALTLAGSHARPPARAPHSLCCRLPSPLSRLTSRVGRSLRLRVSLCLSLWLPQIYLALKLAPTPAPPGRPAGGLFQPLRSSDPQRPRTGCRGQAQPRLLQSPTPQGSPQRPAGGLHRPQTCCSP